MKKLTLIALMSVLSVGGARASMAKISLDLGIVKLAAKLKIACSGNCSGKHTTNYTYVNNYNCAPKPKSMSPEARHLLQLCRTLKAQGMSWYDRANMLVAYIKTIPSRAKALQLAQALINTGFIQPVHFAQVRNHFDSHANHAGKWVYVYC